MVIIGNGFDLHFNQKTSFESYIDSLSVSDESNKLNKLFEELTFLVNKDISLNPVNGQIENDSIHDIKVKIEEIFSCLDGDIPNLSSSERKILAFYIKVCCHQLEIEVIPKLKKDKYSAYSNIYNERGSLLNEFIKKIRLKKIAENRPTFWDIYFLFLKDTNELKNDVNWSDVEKRLLDFYNMPLYRTYSKEVTEYENIYKIIQSFGNRPLNWNQFQKKEFWLIIYTLVEDFNFPKNNFDNYLYDELVSFSKRFVTFLKNEFKPFAVDKKGRNLSTFINNIALNNEKFELLNFNYTGVESDNCVKQIHIHGSINDLDVTPPIIGINVNDLIIM